MFVGLNEFMVVEPLKAGEVTLSDHLMRDMKAILDRSISELGGLVPSKTLFKSVLDHRLEQAISPASLNGTPLFRLPVAFPSKLLGTRLWLEVPVSALDIRLHDWVRSNGVVQHSRDFFLCTGDWEPLTGESGHSSVMREALQINRMKFDYQRTKVYGEYVGSLATGNAIVRNQVALDTEEKINDYFQRFVALFRSIQEHGLLSLEDARMRESKLFGKSVSRKWRTNVGERDIGVALGPRGQLLVLPGGKHRLAIATVLGIPSAAVQVRMLHVDWLRELNKPDKVGWCDAIENGIGQLRMRYITNATSIIN